MGLHEWGTHTERRRHIYDSQIHTRKQSTGYSILLILAKYWLSKREDQSDIYPTFILEIRKHDTSLRIVLEGGDL